MMMRSITAFFLFALSGALSAPATGNASATEPYALSFVASQNHILPGASVSVALLVHAEEEINAFDIELGFSPNTLEYAGTSFVNSIVDVWREEPVIFENGIIRMRGGMIQPFKGNGGQLIEFRFFAKGEGAGQISVREGKLYRADGRGTEVRTEVSFANIVIEKSAPPSRAFEPIPADTQPATFEAYATTDPFSGHRIIVAVTKDSRSSVRVSEIQFRRWIFLSRSLSYANPTEVPRGVWAARVSAKNASGAISHQVIYFPSAGFPKAAGVILILICSAIALRRIIKRQESQPS